MRHYRVYGACLASAVEFPELAVLDGVTPKWRFTTAAALAPAHDAHEVGSERIYADVHARLHAHRHGHRITVDDTGTFDLSRDRRDVIWEHRDASWPDFVRAHCIGRVLSTAMYLDGWLPLHGSAVASTDGVIAFLAPKGFGKSALALALTAAGARLVTDDTLPVETGSPPRAWPGVHSVRVRADSAAALGATADLESHDGKLVVTDLAPGQLLTEPAPLRAVYLLDPILSDPSADAAVRTQVSETVAAVNLVAHVKIGRMLGPSAAPVMLERAAAIARAVPVYRLKVARDLTRLRDVANRILSWHGGSA